MENKLRIWYLQFIKNQYIKLYIYDSSLEHIAKSFQFIKTFQDFYFEGKKMKTCGLEVYDEENKEWREWFYGDKSVQNGFTTNILELEAFKKKL